MDRDSAAEPLFQQEKPWESNENTIWLGSTLTLMRNIEKFKFPAKLENSRQKQLISLLSTEFLNCSSLIFPRLIYAENLSPVQKEYLSEHFMTSQSFQQTHSGEAFVVDDNGDFLAGLNIHDHLYLQLIDCKGELENSWNRLMGIETHLGKTITYAFSSKYGFLTADFNQSGTGLLVSTFLQLSLLIHSGRLEEVIQKYKDDSLLFTGMQGNPHELIGDLLVVRNNYTLGVTEENILASIRSFTSKVMSEEKNMRSQIKSTNAIEMKDKVSRAFGVLLHSYQIEVIEALNALSLLKLGTELGWIVGVTTKDLNKLFLRCRRAHLMQQFDSTIKQEELAHKRAEYIHSFLKEVQLHI